MASAPGSEEAGSMSLCASDSSGYQKSWVQAADPSMEGGIEGQPRSIASFWSPLI